MGQRALSLLDQVLSGASNFIAVALVARALDATHFGVFAIAYALLTAALGLVRARWGTEISLAGHPDEARALLGRLTGGLLLAAPGLSALVVGIGLALSGTTNWLTVAVVALAAPVVCLQDLYRFAAVSADRPGVAVASDGVWLVIVGVGWPLGLAAVPALLVWAGAALLALVVAASALRVRPVLTGARHALLRRHPTGEVLAVTSVAMSLASVGSLGAAGRFVGPEAAGSLRGASTLMAPVNAIFAFLSIALVPALHRADRSGDLRACMRLAPALAAVTAAWGGVLLLLPDSWGRLLLGDTWDGARAVLAWTTVEYVALALVAASELGLQVRQEARLLLRVHMTYAVLVLAGGLVGSVVAHEAWVVAACLAVASVVGSAVTWTALVRSVRRSPAPLETVAATEDR